MCKLLSTFDKFEEKGIYEPHCARKEKEEGQGETIISFSILGEFIHSFHTSFLIHEQPFYQDFLFPSRASLLLIAIQALENSSGLWTI